MEMTVKIFQDGDAICALRGENIQEGMAGFGPSIPEALIDLGWNWKVERGEERL